MQRTLWIIAGILGLLLVHAGLLFFMGQPLVCECAQVSFWYGGAALDPQNSQQFADWYSLSHIIHGIFSMHSSHSYSRDCRSAYGFSARWR